MEISFDFLRKDIIGQNCLFRTPYGDRLLTYADFTASGRSLAFIEKYLIHLQREYANTHTEDDITGRHMTGLLQKAKDIIKKSFNASQNCYLIATGTGCTGAIGKLQEILGVKLPSATKQRISSIIQSFNHNTELQGKFWDELMTATTSERPVVFFGPYEHHSNDIAWRDGTIADFIEIDITPEGDINLDDLERKVSDPKYSSRFKIGSFSAASNVTGIKSSVYEIARLLHRYDAIACFDFAASAPYVKIDLNLDDEAYFDAIFLSPHKFLGGPGSTGILVFNQRLYDKTLPPTCPAGGTVDFVSSDAIDYSNDVETRENPGTPGILQTIKAALAIDLKNAIGIENIEARELEYAQFAFQEWGKNPNIQILGNPDPKKRIPIFSLLFRDGDKYLHPKFGTKLLNDLFGIQSRGGCSCTGPYGHRLLQIAPEVSKEFRQVVDSGYLGMKPGWVRLNFHYTMDQTDVKFICDAVNFVATYGSRFLSEYSFDLNTGEWNHRRFVDKDLLFTPDIKHVLHLPLHECFDETPIDRKQQYRNYLEEASRILQNLPPIQPYSSLRDGKVEKLRWFNFIE